MLRLTRKIAPLLSALLLLLLTNAALIVVTTQLILPHTTFWQAPLLDALSRQLGLELRTTQLTLDWHGATPHLTARQIRVSPPDQPHAAPLTAERLTVQLDLLATLRAHRPRLLQISISGLDLTVQRLPSGELVIPALRSLPKSDDPAALTFLLQHGRVAILNSRLTWHDQQHAQPPLALQVTELTNINHGDQHQWRVTLDVLNTNLTVLAQLTGDAAQPLAWSGRLYSDWQMSDLATVWRNPYVAALRQQWQIPDPLAHLQLTTRAAQWRSWSELRGGQLTSAVHQVTVTDVQLQRVASTLHPPLQKGSGGDFLYKVGDILALGSLTAQARWQRDTGDWHTHLRHLGGGIFTTGWTLRGAWQPQRQQLTAALDALPINELRQLVQSAALPLPGQLQPLLAQPLGGQLQQVQIVANLPSVVKAPSNAAATWQLRGQIHDLTAAATAKLPGVKHLNVQFALTASGGVAHLHSTDGELDLRPYLLTALPLRHLDGELGWAFDAAGDLTISAPALVAITSDAYTETRLQLQFRAGDPSPAADIHLHLRDANAAAVGRYLPVKLVKPHLRRWLNQAIVAGELTSGDILLRGRLADYPFKTQQGIFLAVLQLRNGVLDYQPDNWPPLTELAAELRFTANSMEITAQNGQFLNTRLVSGSATLPDLAHATVLNLQLHGAGPASDGLRVLAETPLVDRFGHLSRAFEVTGDLGIELQLDVPLNSDAAWNYRGQLAFDGATSVALRPLGDLRDTLHFDQVRGQLTFTPQGLTAPSLNAQCDGRPLRVQIATTQANRAAGAQTLVTMTATVAVPQLARLFPNALWSVASGESAWQLTLALRNADVGAAAPPLTVQLSSDLRGTALQLPGSLGKSAAAARVLVITTRLIADQPPLLNIRLGTQVQLEIKQLAKDWLISAQVPEGRGQVRIPAASSRQPPLVAELQQLDLKPLLQQAAAAAGDAAAVKSPAAPRSANPRSWPAVTLSIGQLQWGELALGSAALQLVPDPLGIRLQALRVDGRWLTLSGTGSWTDESTRLNVHLSCADSGAVLKQLAIYQGLERGVLEATARLEWAAAPAEVTLAQVGGQIWFELGGGQLLNVEPGVGRMLGILNVNAILRRVTLDFSDVIADGLSFDRVSGQVQLERGRARLNPIQLLSPTADVRITGTTNLVRASVDHLVEITPKIGSGVALASAVAGGPLVGAAVYLVDKAAGGAVDRLSSYQYRVTGDWKQPTLQRTSAPTWSVGQQLTERVKMSSAALVPKKSPAPPADNWFLEQF
ncbi:hypothetical protein HUU62_03570 [Rhodoferax sp. 4810]|uniref:YhdP central domain-containing protein n=1 Tax=Thiospirillum jenense TaxID=1653858 RepID=A0A839HBN4_9GAMM|nr:DUF3971 domain-containing protein [Thiospirillum jenense]MBB1073487.1 hypothetical protein [Rhodoferax jenense]MBB1125974.1 hypothetical protein [Thiospirillum jenense]